MPFTMDPEEIKQGRYNIYYCEECRRDGIPHQVVIRPAGVTDRHSCWGPGIPTHRHVCTGCGKSDGPWVLATDVGGGY